MFLGKQLLNCLWHLEFEIVFSIFFLEVSTLENIKPTLNVKHVLNPIKVSRDNDWVSPLIRSFIFRLHYLNILDKGMEYGHPFQGWKHLWSITPSKHDGCFMNGSEKGVNYATEQQSTKKTPESGRKDLVTMSENSSWQQIRQFWKPTCLKIFITFSISQSFFPMSSLHHCLCGEV